MWVGYSGFKNMQITLGNHKGQFSVEEVTSSRYITFIERGLPNAFAPDRRLGLSIAKWGRKWRAFAGIFGEEAGNVDETGENEALNYNLRLNYLPVLTDNAFIHLGGSYGHSKPFANDEGRTRFRARPETHVADNRFLHTGWIDTDGWNLYGLELAAAAGPVLLQGEYTATSVNQFEGLPKANFSGYYAFASWMITGEKRPYNVEEGEPAGYIYPGTDRSAPSSSPSASAISASTTWPQMSWVARGKRHPGPQLAALSQSQVHGQLHLRQP